MTLTERVASTVLNSASLISERLAGSAAHTLFHMPLARSSMRASERELFDRAHTEPIEVNGASVVTYRWGEGARPVLLVHGWQSRGSRLSSFVPGLLDRGHSVITFDAPGHGDSTGRSTTVLDYRTAITTLHERYGTFEAVVAHSLGALGSFFALEHGVTVRKVVTISGVCDFDLLIDLYSSSLGLRARLRERLREQAVAKLFPEPAPDGVPFSVTRATVTEDRRFPVLVIHDEDDSRIEVTQGHRLAAAFGDRARLVVTRGLGHRRILGDPYVVESVLDFIGSGPDRTGAREYPQPKGAAEAALGTP